MKACKEYGVDFGNKTFKEIIHILQKHSKWMDWLEANCFISKTLLVAISAGDRFKFKGHEVLLINDYNSMGLVVLKTGELLQGFIEVDDPDNIESENAIRDIFELTSAPHDMKELEKILKTRIPKGKGK